MRWFLKDWFGLEDYEKWPRGRQLCWLVMNGLVTGGLTYGFACELSQRWRTDLQGWPLFGWAAAIGALSIMFAIGFAIAFVNAVAKDLSGEVDLAGVFAGPTAGAIAAEVAGWTVGAMAGVVVGMIAGALALVGVTAILGSVGVFGPFFGAGFAFRALVFRILATLYKLPSGARCLPANWKETSFLTDWCLPAELMPGIREHNSSYSLDGLLKEFSDDRDLEGYVFYPAIGLFFFLPAFLYRLNIKATAWFWWPLAYLLKPAPAASAEGEQRQALCWPWSNPAQRSWIVLSIGLALLSLLLHWLVASSRIESDLVTTMPLSVRVLMGLGWARLAAWHVALWIIAGAGAGMLLLAGNACSHHLNGNWKQYRQRWPQNIRLMTALFRVRLLATVAQLMAFGALLVQDQDRTWQGYVPVPDSWVTALADFYHQVR